MKIYRVTPKSNIKLRILATVIDYGLFFTLYWIYIYTMGEETSENTWQLDGPLLLLVPIFWLCYFVVLEAVNQATPGHDICKLKIYKPDGRKISLSDAFKRRVCDPIDIFMYGIPALICISKTEKHQRLGDLFADTMVAKATDVTETEIVF